MTTSEGVIDTRVLGYEVAGRVAEEQEAFLAGSLTEKLMLEHLAVAVRDRTGLLRGQGHFVIYYSPLREWEEAKSNEAIGEWLYGEWSDREVKKPIDTGEVLTGSRLVFGLGRVEKAGNRHRIALSDLAVGLVGKEDRDVHFVGAVRMGGFREVQSAVPEDKFYSTVMGFIHTRGDRAVPARYPLRRR